MVGCLKARSLVRRIERSERSGAGTVDVGLARLKWVGIVAPLVFLALLQVLLHSALRSLHDPPGIVLAFAGLAVGIAAFSFIVFGVVGRLEQRIVDQNRLLSAANQRAEQRNRELAAVLAVGRAGASSLELSEVLDKALDAILEVTSAESAEVWLRADHDELVLERQRGLAPDAFREITRFRWGEGLPGLTAETGAPVLVHDLPHDERFLRRSVKQLGFQSFCALPLRHRAEIVGVLCVAARDRVALCDEAEHGLLEGIGERLALAIENARLHAQVLDRAVLEERERIARELHDGLAQVLGYINTQTLAVRKLIATGRTEEAQGQLRAMEETARTVYADVREAILGLRTPFAPAAGLVPSLRRYLDQYGEMAGVAVDLRVGLRAGRTGLPGSTEIQLMRIVQEALSNIRKHADATRASVVLEGTGGNGLTVTVEDDGRGFPDGRPRDDGWPHVGGLQTMRERAEAIGAGFEIATAPGRGTRVTVRLPKRAAEAP